VRTFWCHDTQYNDTQKYSIHHYDTRVKGLHFHTQHNNASLHAECHYNECCILFIVMLSVTMLNVIMLSVVMVNVIMLSVVMVNVIMLSVMVPTF
jgi:hypothetical protein